MVAFDRSLPRTESWRLFDATAPTPFVAALAHLARCIARSAWLLVRRRVGWTSRSLGSVVKFGDDTTAEIYRYTRIEHHAQEPVVLTVMFQLEVRGNFWHKLFRAESILNTPLFIGFPGFVSKLWLDADEYGRYRGIYLWDGCVAARDYVCTLWWPLMSIARRSSIHFEIRPTTQFTSVGDVPISADAHAWWQAQSVRKARP